MTPTSRFADRGTFPTVRRPWLGSIAVACCVIAATEAFSQTAATGTQTSNRFVVVNNTGLPDDAVFLTFNSAVTGTGGVNTALASSTAYSLDQLKGPVPNASGSGPVGSVPTFDLNAFQGRVYVALGKNTPMTIWPGPGGYNTVAGALELYVDPTDFDGHQNNGDISYVDYYSIPQNLKVKLLDGSGSVSGIRQIVTTPGTTIGNLLTSSTLITPTSARYSANYSVLNSTSSLVGTMTGLAQVVAPSPNSQYPGFGSFFEAMQSSGSSLTVASYTTPVGPPTPPGNPKPGTLYGFGGVPVILQTDPNPFDPSGTPATGGTPPSWEGTRSEAWYVAQSYTLSAEYVADLTAGLPAEAVARLLTSGIPANTVGLRMFTSGYVAGTSNNASASSVGDYGIYITATELANSASTYGANPQYVIDWGGAATATSGTTGTDAQIVTTSNFNSLSDRVVGDFMSAMTFGWGLAGTATAGTPYTVAEHAATTSTAAVLVNSIFDTLLYPTGESAGPIGALSTGEYLYLADLQAGAGNIGYWTGSGIQPTQPTWYDTYGAFQSQTDAYAFPYSDRLVMNSPDIYWWPQGSTTDLDTFYLEWTLNPGSYVFVAVPEPSAIALVGISGAALSGLAWWRRRGPARQPVPE